MTKSEQGKANRQYYLSRGRCPRCGGKNPLQKGRVLCIECQQKHDEEQNERRKRWKAEGRCTRCGSDKGGPGTLCPDCKAYMTDIRRNNAQVCKARRDRLRMEGKCTRCGIRYAELGRSWCRKCLDAHKAYTNSAEQRAKTQKRREALVAAGRCIDCGKPTNNGKKRCDDCLAARRDSTIKYKILKKMDAEAAKARRRSNAAK